MHELILSKVRLLTADNPAFDNMNDDTLMIYIEEAYNEAQAYCNTEDLPEESSGAIALMVVDLIKQNILGGNISSLSEADRSVSYNSISSMQLKDERKKILDKWKVSRLL